MKKEQSISDLTKFKVFLDGMGIEYEVSKDNLSIEIDTDKNKGLFCAPCGYENSTYFYIKFTEDGRLVR